jgi:hypothetical protein
MICEHFYFDEGDSGYSEVTPGWASYGGCRLKHWEDKGFVDWPNVGIEKAKDCNDFEVVNINKSFLFSPWTI